MGLALMSSHPRSSYVTCCKSGKFMYKEWNRTTYTNTGGLGKFYSFHQQNTDFKKRDLN